MRLGPLFGDWKAGNKPRPQTALEFKDAVDDFIDFAGDIAVATIDAGIVYIYRDQAALLLAKMPRADRSLPSGQQLARYAGAELQVTAPTL